MFRVGQKVCCIDDADADDLAKGVIYTVSEIRHFTANEADRAGTGIRLFEVASRETAVSWGYYLATRFRPIVSRPTSIEFAHEILRSVNAPTKERAHV